MEWLAVASSAVATISGICAIILFFVSRKKLIAMATRAASGGYWRFSAHPRLKNP